MISGKSPGRNGTARLPAVIRDQCDLLGSKKIRGDLGAAIAALVLLYSPRDLQQMRWNFSEKIRDIDPGYRKNLEQTITSHLQGAYQTLRLMHRQGAFSALNDPVPDPATAYWAMVAGQCAAGDEEDLRLRFLKYLLSGFCMLVQLLPGHPAGMLFPGGDRVEFVDGVYYCPVREKADDVDSALCPFCPALQTPQVGYLRPPVTASGHRKQEYIGHVYEHHHFNG